MTAPRDPDALARMHRGRAGERPIPRYLECATRFEVPDRILRADLSPSAFRVAVALCAESRIASEMATDADNERLGHRARLSPRRVQSALAELEDKGFVFRLDARDHLGLDTLQWGGYRDIWGSPGQQRPARAIVLLWRLPHPSSLGPSEPSSIPCASPGLSSKGGSHGLQ